MAGFRNIPDKNALRAYLAGSIDSKRDENTWTFEGLSFETRYRFKRENGISIESFSVLSFIKLVLQENSLLSSGIRIIFVGCRLKEFVCLEHDETEVEFHRSIIDVFHWDSRARKPVNIFNDSLIKELIVSGHIRADFHADRCSIGSLSTNGAVVFSRRFSLSGCRVGISRGGAEELSFNDAKFLAPTSFSECIFFQAPSFFKSELHEDTDFKDAQFLDVSSSYSWRAYRTLKHHMMRFESDHEVQIFHALELEARYNTELPKGWRILSDPKGVETIASWFMRGLNNYGQHLWLPLVLLLYIGCWFLVLYAASGGVGYFPAEDKNIAGWVQNAGQHYSNVTFAARNFFGPFGLILSADELQPNNMLVKTLGVAHFIISSVIWFIWILQIRSRFKL